MDNDRFQEMVLEHLAHITQEITEIKIDLSGVKSDVATLKSDVADLKNGQEIIKAQVAELAEFRSEATQKLDRLVEDVTFLKHKEKQNEEDIFKLKNHLQIVK